MWGAQKEEAQAALINNNMDLRSAIGELHSLYYHAVIFLTITTSNSVVSLKLWTPFVLLCITAELMASHNSLDPSVAARSSTAAPVDVRFPPGVTAARPQQVLVDQLQQQQQQQRLLSSLGGILSSNLPINANQLQVTIQYLVVGDQISVLVPKLTWWIWRCFSVEKVSVRVSDSVLDFSSLPFARLINNFGFLAVNTHSLRPMPVPWAGPLCIAMQIFLNGKLPYLSRKWK